MQGQVTTQETDRLPLTGRLGRQIVWVAGYQTAKVIIARKMLGNPIAKKFVF